MEDFLVLANAVGSFACFVGCHLVFFRLCHATHIIQFLVRNFMVIGTINAVISGLLFGSGGILLGIVSFCLYSILSFSYVICCVGPYETSVRLRIVRELYKQPQGMRLERLLGFYNNRRILDLRLQRLLASKDLILENGVYRDNRGSSVFTGITAITEFLKRCYGV